MAVYNNRTVDLNAKMTSRSNQGTSMQQIMAFAAFLLPFAVYVPLRLAFDDTVARWTLAALGLGFILTSRLWIRTGARPRKPQPAEHRSARRGSERRFQKIASVHKNSPQR